MESDDTLANSGESISIADRTIVRAKCLEEIKYWSRMVNRIKNGGIKLSRLTPE